MSKLEKQLLGYMRAKHESQQENRKLRHALEYGEWHIYDPYYIERRIPFNNQMIRSFQQKISNLNATEQQKQNAKIKFEEWKTAQQQKKKLAQLQQQKRIANLKMQQQKIAKLKMQQQQAKLKEAEIKKKKSRSLFGKFF